MDVFDKVDSYEGVLLWAQRKIKALEWQYKQDQSCETRDELKLWREVQNAALDAINFTYAKHNVYQIFDEVINPDLAEDFKVDPRYIEKKTKRVQLVLQPSIYERAKAAADDQGVSFNEYIHRLIDENTERG